MKKQKNSKFRIGITGWLWGGGEFSRHKNLLITNVDFTVLDSDEGEEKQKPFGTGE